MVNLMIVFLISGLWHGAGWTFVIWGALHGLASVIHRLWRLGKYRLNKFVSWLLTLGFVNFAWVFFRADSVQSALAIINKMLSKPELHSFRANVYRIYDRYDQLVFYIVLAISIMVSLKNEPSKMNKVKPSYQNLFFIIILFVLSVFFMNSIEPKEFLYFDF